MSFAPRLLHRAEFAAEPFEFQYVDLAGREASWSMPAGSLAFTWCGTPVCYRLGPHEGLAIEKADGSTMTEAADRISIELSRSLFARDGIRRITVTIPETSLRP